MKEMKRLWLILFVISSVCGQDKKDVLVLKGGSIYQGEYVNIEDGEVFLYQKVPLVLNLSKLKQ